MSQLLQNLSILNANYDKLRIKLSKTHPIQSYLKTCQHQTIYGEYNRCQCQILQTTYSPKNIKTYIPIDSNSYSNNSNT